MKTSKTLKKSLSILVVLASLSVSACGSVHESSGVFETIVPETIVPEGETVVEEVEEAFQTLESKAEEILEEAEKKPETTEESTETAIETLAVPEKKKYSSSSMPEYVCGAWVAGVGEYRDFPSTQTTDAASLKIDCDLILDNAEKMGINVLFFHVRPSSDAFYASQYYPWSRYLTGVQGLAPDNGFDPLSYMVEGAHARGIQLHAWINPYRIRTDGAAPSSGVSPIPLEALVSGNPALTQLSNCILPCSDGFYYLDPAEPAVRDMVVKGALEIAENYNVDGIHMDDYFYPSAGIDDSLSYAKYGGGQDIGDWRRANVNALVKELDERIHAVRPGLSFGISPSGIWANKSDAIPGGSATKGMEARNQLYADSVTWIKNGWVDYIIPQIYWEIGKEIADYSVLVPWWCNQVEGTDVRFYIGMADYRSMLAGNDTGNVWYGEKMLRQECKLNDSYPLVSGEVHFNFKSISQDKRLSDMYEERYGK